MSNPLDAIVRTAEPGTPIDPSCQVLVPIDTRTGQPARPTFLSFGRKHWKHLIVTNSRNSGAVALRRHLTVGVEDFSLGWRFDLLLDYEARCTPGREVRAAQALWSGASPQERLEALLRGWVLQQLDGHAADFVCEFDSAAERLAEELRDRAFQQTGLTLAVKVYLPDAGRVDPLCIGPVTLPLHLCDCDDEVDLGFEAQFTVEPGKERVAFLHREQGGYLERTIRERVRDHFAIRVTLQRFHTDLSAEVQRDLWRELDGLVRPYGRRLVRLSLEGDAFPEVVESTRLEHRFTHGLRDYPKPVEVKTELLLQLIDLGRYVRAKAPRLESWVRKEVEEATIHSLFGITYTDLCLHFEEKKSEIEKSMKERAAAIGYELRQLITVTDLQFDILRRPFLVQLKDDFSTRLAKLKVPLEIHASLVVPNPSEIGSLLNRNIDVTEQIHQRLLERLREKLHQIDPESFYMEFEKAKKGPSVRAQLESVIRETVKKEFHADVLSLSCKQLDTEFSLRLERLMTPRHDFSVEVVVSNGGPPVAYDGSFRVDGVDEKGWSYFHTSNPEPDKLIACTERELRYRLSDGTALHLLQTTNAEQTDKVQKWLHARILREFGLKIQVMDWVRRPLKEQTEAAQARLKMMADIVQEQETRIELASEMRGRHKAMQAAAAESRLKQLEELQQRLTRVTVAGDSLEEEQELRDKIIALQKEQKDVLAEVTKERSNLILPQLETAQGILTERAEGIPRGGEAKPEEPPAAPGEQAGG